MPEQKVNKIAYVPAEIPVKGKTYSLFGDTGSSVEYYGLISELADEYLEKHPDVHGLLAQVQATSKKKRHLQSIPELSVYTRATKEHLKNASAFTLRDDIKGTTEEQYHLYMLEVELTNRAFAKDFKNSDVKVAFLPHCLHDLDKDCLSRVEPGDFDYTCRRCSKKCFINHVSRILKARDIKPYIWREAELSDIFKATLSTGASLGILGIACFPELVHGMRSCEKHNLPVVGIPLNANRCRRWMGKFHPTSVNLDRLERLVG